MSDSTDEIPPHERFGYDVVERALAGEGLPPWENDYARLFWQSLEVHNGGFEQWIGNTGVEGALETLDILDRLDFGESHRLTKLAFDVMKVWSYTGEESFYAYLDAYVDSWSERLEPLEEAYFDDADAFDEKLRQIFQANTE